MSTPGKIKTTAVLLILVGLAGFCAGPAAVGARARHSALSVAFSCAIATGLFGLGWQATRELRKTNPGAWATATSLGMIRCWVALVLGLDLAMEDMASLAQLPQAVVNPPGCMRWLFEHGLAAWAADRDMLTALHGATLVLLFLACIGWRTRLVVPAATLFSLLCAGILRSYTRDYHQGLWPTWLLGALSLTRCGDGWSLDQWLKGESVSDSSGQDYE